MQAAVAGDCDEVDFFFEDDLLRAYLVDLDDAAALAHHGQSLGDGSKTPTSLSEPPPGPTPTQELSSAVSVTRPLAMTALQPGVCVDTASPPSVAGSNKAGSDVTLCKELSQNNDETNITDLGESTPAPIIISKTATATAYADDDGLHLMDRPCIACRLARVKCNRKMPCGRCDRYNIECTVPAPVKRGRPPRAVAESKAKRQGLPEACVMGVVGHQPAMPLYWNGCVFVPFQPSVAACATAASSSSMQLASVAALGNATYQSGFQLPPLQAVPVLAAGQLGPGLVPNYQMPPVVSVVEGSLTRPSEGVDSSAQPSAPAPPACASPPTSPPAHEDQAEAGKVQKADKAQTAAHLGLTRHAASQCKWLLYSKIFLCEAVPVGVLWTSAMMDNYQQVKGAQVTTFVLVALVVLALAALFPLPTAGQQGISGLEERRFFCGLSVTYCVIVLIVTTATANDAWQVPCDALMLGFHPTCFVTFIHAILLIVIAATQFTMICCRSGRPWAIARVTGSLHSAIDITINIVLPAVLRVPCAVTKQRFTFKAGQLFELISNSVEFSFLGVVAMLATPSNRLRLSRWVWPTYSLLPRSPLMGV